MWGLWIGVAIALLLVAERLLAKSTRTNRYGRSAGADRQLQRGGPSAISGVAEYSPVRNFSPSGYLSRRPALFSPTELAFWKVLTTACPPDLVVCPMVRLADLVKCDRASFRNGMFNRMSQKHVDFVLIGADRGDILLVIELDDKSHLAPKRRARDELVDTILERAGILILRMQPAKEHQPITLRMRIDALLQSERSSAA